jgi:hypothetical protein
VARPHRASRRAIGANRRATCGKRNEERPPVTPAACGVGRSVAQQLALKVVEHVLPEGGDRPRPPIRPRGAPSSSSSTTNTPSPCRPPSLSPAAASSPAPDWQSTAPSSPAATRRLRPARPPRPHRRRPVDLPGRPSRQGRPRAPLRPHGRRWGGRTGSPAAYI